MMMPSTYSRNCHPRTGNRPGIARPPPRPLSHRPIPIAELSTIRGTWSVERRAWEADDGPSFARALRRASGRRQTGKRPWTVGRRLRADGSHGAQNRTGDKKRQAQPCVASPPWWERTYVTMLSTKRGVRAQHGNALLGEGVRKVFGMSAAL